MHITGGGGAVGRKEACSPMEVVLAVPATTNHPVTKINHHSTSRLLVLTDTNSEWQRAIIMVASSRHKRIVRLKRKKFHNQ